MEPSGPDLLTPLLIPALLALLVIVLSLGYSKLYIARKLIWERQEKGLVGSHQIFLAPLSLTYSQARCSRPLVPLSTSSILQACPRQAST